MRSSASRPLGRGHVPDVTAAAYGTLRHHRLRPDRSVRDSACFNVIATEWPAVRARLLARLGRA